MTAWISYSVLVGVIAYLCGSIPSGYWLGRLLKEIDIREHGSRSTGATNVLRVVGKVPALVVLLIDLLKGVAAVAFARWHYSLPTVVGTKPAAIDLNIWLSWAIAGAALLAMSWPVGFGCRDLLWCRARAVADRFIELDFRRSDGDPPHGHLPSADGLFNDGDSGCHLCDLSTQSEYPTALGLH